MISELENKLSKEYYTNISNFEISFGKSNSKFYPDAIKICDKIGSKKDKNGYITVCLNNDNFELVENLISCVLNWKSTLIKVNGKAYTGKEYINGRNGRGCFRHSPKIPGKLECYCVWGVKSISELFSLDHYSFFGCRHLDMWFRLRDTTAIDPEKRYSHFSFKTKNTDDPDIIAKIHLLEEKVGVLGSEILENRDPDKDKLKKWPEWLTGHVVDEYFHVDKEALKRLIQNKLNDQIFCPVFNIEKCYDRIEKFPNKLKCDYGTEKDVKSDVLKLLFQLEKTNMDEVYSLMKKKNFNIHL